MSAVAKQRSDLFWAAVENLGSAALAIATTLVIARLLGPSEFGLIMAAIAFVQLGSYFAENAFNDALVRHPDLDADHVKSAYLASIALGGVLAAGFAALAGPIAALFEAPALRPAIVVFSLTLVLNGLCSVPASMLRRGLEFRQLALRTLWARVAGTVVAIALLLVGFGVWAVVWQQVVAGASSFLCMLPYARRAMGGRFSLASLRELLPISAFTSTTSLVGIAGQRGLIALISVLFGSYILGLVTVAVRIVETLRGMINGAGVQLIQRRMALRIDDRGALRDFYVAASQLLASLAVPAFMGIYVCAPEIITILLQPQWIDAVDAVRVLCLAGAISSFRVFDGTVCSSLGRPQLNLVVTSVALAAAVAGVAVLGFAGSDQAALAWLLRAVVGFVLSAAILHATGGVDIATQTRAMWPVALAALVMTGALLAIQKQLPASLSPTARVAIVVPLGVVLYFAVLLPLAPATGRRLLQLARGR